jgi:hypothetical protein
MKPRPSGARTLTGMCLCRAASYTLADEFTYAANCHCSNCRRTTGSAFKPFAGIERDKLEVTKGEDNLMIFGDETGNDTKAGWFTITDNLPQFDEHAPGGA